METRRVWVGHLAMVSERCGTEGARLLCRTEVLAAFMTGVRDLLRGCSATFGTFFDEPSLVVGRENVLGGRLPTEAFVGAFMAMIEELLSEHGQTGTSSAGVASSPPWNGRRPRQRTGREASPVCRHRALLWSGQDIDSETGP